MSKIAEQKALEAYPDHPVWKVLYQEGYDKALQDFFEKAEEFLYLQLNNGSIECGNIEKLIEQFKNYMQK